MIAEILAEILWWIIIGAIGVLTVLSFWNFIESLKDRQIEDAIISLGGGIFMLLSFFLFIFMILGI